MAAKVMSSSGTQVFTLKYGTAPSQNEIKWVLGNVGVMEADGLELEECRRILNRPVQGTKHRFNTPDTMELVLNWFWV